MIFKDKTALLHKMASGKASEEDKKSFEAWLDSLTDDEYQQFMDEYQKISLNYTSKISNDLWDKIEYQILSHDSEVKGLRKRKFLLPIAASILFAFGVSMFFLLGRPNQLGSEKKMSANLVLHEIVPGSNKAILKLDDGTRINLEDSDEEILLQSGYLITKTKNGKLVYGENKSPNDDSKGVHYNTIETPKGGQYQVVLPDGTKVWLNAFSSLKFPTAFKGKERNVELIGEAYFEVAKNEKQPFIVNTGREIVRVLGTHFNINSYRDEKLSKTTLVEGKVKISLAVDSAEMNSLILNPGEQSINNSKRLEIITTDVQESLAWKNGEFMFNNDDIESVMRKISRWYDVEVIYPQAIKNSRIWGSVSRFEDISEVLKTIELTGSIHFKVEGRRVYVMK